ncbi:MAG: glycerol-3-phosphate transporter, partial [Desulfobulbaceae bacterium]
MVEKRGLGLWATHISIIIGICVICFPIYVAFIASTVTQADLISPPMPLVPGGHFIENYQEALLSGMSAPVWKMLLNSLVMALGIT